MRWAYTFSNRVDQIISIKWRKYKKRKFLYGNKTIRSQCVRDLQIVSTNNSVMIL
jgi:hypothetical protein